jgi:CRP/FNR family transcriptional regulator, cyclic AMP receptor protein
VADVEQLASVPLFNSLHDGELAELAQWFEEKNAGEGVRLCGEGAPGYCFFVLTGGTATVTCEGECVSNLGPGDFFGEIAILGEGRRTATVTATSPSSVLVMFGGEFRRLEAAHPDIAARIRDAMEERLAART